jgi:hypothetical protein
MHRKQYSAFSGEGVFWRAHESGSEGKEKVGQGLKQGFKFKGDEEEEELYGPGC